MLIFELIVFFLIIIIFIESKNGGIHSCHNICPGHRRPGYHFGKCWIVLFVDSHERGSNNDLLGIAKNHLRFLDSFLC